MLKRIAIIPSLLVTAILFWGASCSKDDPEPRTREMEWEELDAWMKRLENEGHDIDTTDLTIFYIVRKKGDGPFPKIGDDCTISYIGFANGNKIEDSNDIHSNGKWRFVYKPPHDVAGFINAIGYMNKGSEIEMYIHSDFAFGAKGTAKVPPYTTLVYRATMHEMNPAK